MIKPSLRSLENLHIPLWLLKDICWLMEWKEAAIIASLPTLLVAVWLCILSKNQFLNFIPNISVLFWLLANMSWMIMEFSGNVYKVIPATLFGIGLVFMVRFYLPRHDKEIFP